jgi:hypothetical protein
MHVHIVMQSRPSVCECGLGYKSWESGTQRRTTPRLGPAGPSPEPAGRLRPHQERQLRATQKSVQPCCRTSQKKTCPHKALEPRARAGALKAAGGSRQPQRGQASCERCRAESPTPQPDHTSHPIGCSVQVWTAWDARPTAHLESRPRSIVCTHARRCAEPRCPATMPARAHCALTRPCGAGAPMAGARSAPAAVGGAPGRLSKWGLHGARGDVVSVRKGGSARGGLLRV